MCCEKTGQNVRLWPQYSGSTLTKLIVEVDTTVYREATEIDGWFIPDTLNEDDSLTIKLKFKKGSGSNEQTEKTLTHRFEIFGSELSSIGITEDTQIDFENWFDDVSSEHQKARYVCRTKCYYSVAMGRMICQTICHWEYDHNHEHAGNSGM